jgi:hypothetical protein
MTIPTEVAQLKIETDGTNDPIDLTSEFGALYFLAFADVVVYYRDPDGVETLWNLGDDYSLSGNGAEGEGVLTPIAATEAGGHICVFRLTPLVQDLNLEENDGFPAESLERAQDRQILIDQDSRRMILSAVRGCVCDPPMAPLPCASDRADKCMHFDANGNPIAVDCSTSNIFQLTHTVDYYGNVVPAGQSGEDHIDFPCEPIGWVIHSKEQGSIALDIRVKAYVENTPPTAGDSIVGATPPALVDGKYKRSTDVADWSIPGAPVETPRLISGPSGVIYNVNSCTGITRFTLVVLLRRVFGDVQ